jgi:hypothetical protein
MTSSWSPQSRALQLGSPQPGSRQSGPTQRNRHDSTPEPGAAGSPVVIDCDHCRMRGVGCGDCVVTVLLGSPPPGTALSDDERHALDVLSSAGLVPPLRMVDSRDSVAWPDHS